MGDVLDEINFVRSVFEYDNGDASNESKKNDKPFLY